jgi:steroid delta-isomerase-like uncharacterized protein
MKVNFNMIKIFIIASLLLVPLGSCDQKDQSQDIEKANEKAVINFVTTVWNDKDVSSLEMFFSNQFTRRVNNVEIASNAQELSANIQVYFTGFPDLNLSINEIFSCRDQVFMNWTISGTNTGVFGEFPATGKKIKVSGITRIDFDETGKFIYEDVYYNELALLQQLGYSLTPPEFE